MKYLTIIFFCFSFLANARSCPTNKNLETLISNYKIQVKILQDFRASPRETELKIENLILNFKTKGAILESGILLEIQKLIPNRQHQDLIFNDQTVVSISIPAEYKTRHGVRNHGGSHIPHYVFESGFKISKLIKIISGAVEFKCFRRD